MIDHWEFFRQVMQMLASYRYQLERLEQSPEGGFVNYCMTNWHQARGQLFQDLFVVLYFNELRGGYFVEFGGADGRDTSNTFLLEKQFGWNGIVAEPARCWHEALRTNRGCIVDSRCVWRASGETLEFNEATTGEHSSLSSHFESELPGGERELAAAYPVETVSLNDLLAQHQAPQTIDYLSVDTEGTEFEILNAFDFDRFDVRVITVEHNFLPQRQQIFDLLTARGYLRVLEPLTKWDDWYIKPQQS